MSEQNQHHAHYPAALEVPAKLHAEDVHDEATWAELERLARVANADDRLAEIYAAELDKISADEPSTARLSFRTGALFDKQGNRDRALVFYRRTYQFARTLHADVFLGSHGQHYGLLEKLAKRGKGANPFIDETTLPRHVDTYEKQFQEEMAKQTR
jgi:hypothetical protein